MKVIWINAKNPKISYGFITIFIILRIYATLSIHAIESDESSIIESSLALLG